MTSSNQSRHCIPVFQIDQNSVEICFFISAINSNGKNVSRGSRGDGEQQGKLFGLVLAEISEYVRSKLYSNESSSDLTK